MDSPDSAVHDSTAWLEITGNSLTAHMQSHIDRMHIQLDESQSPRTIDVTAEGDHQKRQRGLYALNAGTLQLCFAMDGAAGRPTALRSDQKLRWAVVTYEKTETAGAAAAAAVESRAKDLRLYERQKAILSEVSAANGNPEELASVIQKYAAELEEMASDLSSRLDAGQPHRKFLLWNAKYRSKEIGGSDAPTREQAIKDFEGNLKQAEQYLTRQVPQESPREITAEERAADLAIYQRQKELLTELEQSQGDVAELKAIIGKHTADLQRMTDDLQGRLSPNAPSRKFLMWNAKYRSNDMLSDDRAKVERGLKEFKSNLQQAATYLQIKE